MSEFSVVETRNITLPQGGTLEVKLSQSFIDRVKQHFGIFGDQLVDDDHVRMYLFGAFDSAITKVEREVKDDKSKGNTEGVC